jgi:hypothetical protein
MNQGFKISFQPLFRVAQFLTLAMLILIPIQIIIFVIAPDRVPSSVEFAVRRIAPNIF